jgi:hypothetical protein
MSTLLAVVVESVKAEPSKTAFYIAGGLLVGWALLIGALGVARPAFAEGEGTGRAIMALTVVLVAATMAAAIITA